MTYIDDMDQPYWVYESCIGNTTNVSIRASKTVGRTQYFIFLSKFITDHVNRILSIDNPLTLTNGSYVTIIRLIGNQEVTYPNKL
ncbi:hypothetical protein QJ857_gp0502 [Tupanvirus soda lake]|uniref:Uncharacterized protein n=2 Tax=Tupanvirus TaxID=2094720 RepID=A0A6N1NM33_9VIRU|nr:hypothetical protein QJ857_gp0502 [Tupanvirus soda lake]QKU35539.1 hypothetical protein [Tupanvirus soda lake]